MSIKQEFSEKLVDNNIKHEQLADQEIANITENSCSVMTAGKTTAKGAKSASSNENKSILASSMSSNNPVAIESPDYSFVNLTIQPRPTLDLLQRNLSSSPTYNVNGNKSLKTTLESLENDVNFILHKRTATTTIDTSAAAPNPQQIIPEDQHISFFNPKKHWLKCSKVVAEENSSSLSLVSPPPPMLSSISTNEHLAATVTNSQPPPKKRRHLICHEEEPSASLTIPPTTTVINSFLNNNETVFSPAAINTTEGKEITPIESHYSKPSETQLEVTDKNDVAAVIELPSVDLNLNQHLLEPFYSVRQALAIIQQQPSLIVPSAERTVSADPPDPYMDTSASLLVTARSHISSSDGLNSNISLTSVSSSLVSCLNETESVIVDLNALDSNASKKKVSLAEYRMRKETTTTATTISPSSNSKAKNKYWSRSRLAMAFGENENSTDTEAMTAGESELPASLTTERLMDDEEKVVDAIEEEDVLVFSKRKLSLAVSKLMGMGRRGASVNLTPTVKKAGNDEAIIESNPQKSLVALHQVASLPLVNAYQVRTR